jgi:hypothetical protein
MSRIIATLLIALLAGCGTRTSVTSSWQEPVTTKVPFEHVLVVAVSPNSRLRRSFEQALTDLLTTRGTKASAAIVVGGAKKALDRDAVAEMVRSTGADAVLVTRLASRRVSLEEDPTRVGVKTERPASLSDGPGLVELFSQTYHEYEEPGEITARSKATLESSLYEAVDGGRLVYTLITKAEFEEGKDDVVADVTSAIARHLRRDGLIR